MTEPIKLPPLLLEDALKRAYYYTEAGEWRYPEDCAEWDRWHSVAKVATLAVEQATAELRAEVERLRAELARRMDEAHIQRFAALFAEAERMRIRKELNTLRWMGHDEGWDLAVEAIRKWLEGDAKSNFAKNATVHTTTLPLLREPGVFAGGASQAVVSGKTMEPK